MNRDATQPQTRVKVQEKADLLVIAGVVAALLVLLALLPDEGTIAALVVLIAGTVIDPRGVDRPAYSYGLPGVPDGPQAPSRILVWGHSAVSVTAALLAIVLTVLDAPWVLFTMLALVAVVAWAICAERMIRFWHHGRRLRRGLEAYAPTIAMGFAGRAGAPWQLRMWEPYLLRSGERCVVISLHEKYVQMILDGAELSSPYIQLADA